MERQNNGIFSPYVEEIIARRESNVSLEDAVKFGRQRLEHFMAKVQPAGQVPHTLDHTCLDMSHAGAYLSNLLDYSRKKGNDEYNEVYEMGRKLIERLAILNSLDPTLDLEDIIYNLVYYYKHDA